MSEIETQDASPKIQAIRALAAAGFALIPLKGKLPAIKNWTKTAPGKYGEAELAPGNYGVVLGPEDLVIDVDPRNFAWCNGDTDTETGALKLFKTEAEAAEHATIPPFMDKPVARLTADIGAGLKSFIVKTGGGGLHIYLKVPGGVGSIADLPRYPGVEFKSLGRQVVGPGSIHPETGAEYQIACGTPDIREVAPEKLLALIRVNDKSKDFDANAGTGKYINDTATRERFASYLQTAEPAIEGQGGDQKTFTVAAHGRDLGLPPEASLDLMLAHWNERCQPCWSPDDLKAKVINAYKYGKNKVGASHPAADFTPVEAKPAQRKDGELSWDVDRNGNVKTTFNNLLNHLKSPRTGLHTIFGYNEFTGRAEIVNPAPWHKGKMPAHRAVTDNDLKLLRAYLAVNHKFEMSIADIEGAVVVTAYANKFHPVREYLESLTWDGVPRLDNWLRDFCGAPDDEYTRAVSRKVICAAVMRVFKPGVKFDYCAVLEGAQGIGKSAICAILGGEWAGDFSVDPTNKDTIQLMQGKWIIELAELEVLSSRRADNDALKAFISRQMDTARLAYGRLANEFPRQSVFIATKNPGVDGTYLKDDTGNRRWWPVALSPKGGQVDFKGLKAARNQLFAEARMRCEAGEPLDMDTLELRFAAKMAAGQRHAEHEWKERIASWLDGKPELDFISGRDVFVDCLGGVDKQFDRRASMSISLCMRDLAWTRGVKRVNGRPVKGYFRNLPELGDLA